MNEQMAQEMEEELLRRLDLEDEALDADTAPAAAAASSADEELTSEAADDRPRYLIDLERRAQASGISLDEVYDADQNRVLAERTSQCVRPDVAMQYAIDPSEITVGEKDHVDSCSYCQELVATSRPSSLSMSKLERSAAALNVAYPVEPESVVAFTQTAFDRLDELFPRSLVVVGMVIPAFLVGFFTYHFQRELIPTAAPTDELLAPVEHDGPAAGSGVIASAGNAGTAGNAGVVVPTDLRRVLVNEDDVAQLEARKNDFERSIDLINERIATLVIAARADEREAEDTAAAEAAADAGDASVPASATSEP